MIRDIVSIKNEYFYTRQRNLKAYEEKKAKTYEKFPKLYELDQKIIDLMVESLKGGDLDEVDKARLERDKFIKVNNIDPTYIDVQYTCKKCKDTGFINGEKCDCFKRKEMLALDNVTKFSSLIKDSNFDKLDFTLYKQDIKMHNSDLSYSDYMKNAILHMKDSIKNASVTPYNAIFIGATGTGKTFLARSIGAEFFKNGKTVLYINVNEYISSLKPDYDGEPLEGFAKSCDLLIIDDLGTENPTDFSNSKLNYIIDKRLNDKKSTVITTNLTLDEMKKIYLGSMISRIAHLYSKYILMGDDLRRIVNA